MKKQERIGSRKSWVVVEIATNKPVAETWKKGNAELINKNSRTHKAVSIIEWLSALNGKLA